MRATKASEDTDPEGGHRPELSLQNPNRYPEARKAKLGPWLECLVVEIAPEASSLAVRFVGDRAIRRLNREFRGRDRVTDVLSFAGDESVEGRHLGDVAVSVPAARRQAERAGLSVEVELKTLLLHGVLHCLGYDHETDLGEMGRLEARLRRRWVGEG